MKKTLLVTMDFYPSVGGISHYWERLSECMPSAEWVVLAPELPVGVFERIVSYTLYRRTFLSKLLWPRWLRLVKEIIIIIKKEKIRCIIAAQVLPVGSAVRIAALLTGIPYVVSLHGMDLGCAQKSYRKYNLARSVLRHARNVITNSSYTAFKAMQYGVAKDLITYIYPCADIPQVIPMERSGEYYPVLLTVSRLVRRKGIQYVIEALPNILQVFPTCHYIIAGGGHMRRELSDLVKAKGLGGHVEFVGIVSKETKDALYRDCDIFVMVPYEENGDVEGFGMVYLEANSFGKPVIGTNSGGIPDAISDGKTGVLVEEKKSTLLADAVIRLASDSALSHTLGSQGRERVQGEFQWIVQAKKLQTLLTYL